MHKIKYMQNYLRETKWLPGEIGYIQVNGISLFKKKQICQQKEAVCMKYILKKMGFGEPERLERSRTCGEQETPTVLHSRAAPFSEPSLPPAMGSGSPICIIPPCP